MLGRFVIHLFFSESKIKELIVWEKSAPMTLGLPHFVRNDAVGGVPWSHYSHHGLTRIKLVKYQSN